MKKNLNIRSFRSRTFFPVTCSMRWLWKNCRPSASKDYCAIVWGDHGIDQSNLLTGTSPLISSAAARLIPLRTDTRLWISTRKLYFIKRPHLQFRGESPQIWGFFLDLETIFQGSQNAHRTYEYNFRRSHTFSLGCDFYKTYCVYVFM